MLEAGFLVALGLTVIFWKLGWRARLWMLSHPIFMDVSVFVILTFVHWGTFTGVMAATVGALMCSVLLAAGRWLFGHTERGQYVSGKVSVKV